MQFLHINLMLFCINKEVHGIIKPIVNSPIPISRICFLPSPKVRTKLLSCRLICLHNTSSRTVILFVLRRWEENQNSIWDFSSLKIGMQKYSESNQWLSRKLEWGVIDETNLSYVQHNFCWQHNLHVFDKKLGLHICMSH